MSPPGFHESLQIFKCFRFAALITFHVRSCPGTWIKFQIQKNCLVDLSVIEIRCRFSVIFVMNVLLIGRWRLKVHSSHSYWWFLINFSNKLLYFMNFLPKCILFITLNADTKFSWVDIMNLILLFLLLLKLLLFYIWSKKFKRVHLLLFLVN